MIGKYSIDFVKKTITVSSDFMKAMSNPNSEEYMLVKTLCVDFPSMKVVKRTHAKPKAYKTESGELYEHNQFKGLTYEKMEKFIEALSDNEAIKAEYEKARAFAKAANRNGYVYIRKWFMAQFPEYLKNPLFYINNSPMIVDFEKIANSEGVA